MVNYLKNPLVILFLVAGLLAFGFFAYNQSRGVTPGGPQALVQGQGGVISGVSGTCPDTGFVTVGVLARESLANTITGVKAAAAGQAQFYEPSGINSLGSVTTTTAGSYVTTATVVRCNQQFFVVWNASSGYYPTKSAIFTAPNAASFNQELPDTDVIGTLALRGYNDTAPGTRMSNAMAINISRDSTNTGAYLGLQVTNARGVYRKPLICFDYNTANVSQARITGTSVSKYSSVPNLALPSSNSAEECWLVGIDSVTEPGGEVKVGLAITPASGVDILDNTVNSVNVSVFALDAGYYIKAANGILFEDYQNPDTSSKATYSAALGRFNITLNGVVE